ncbi:MAG: hypothetical protein JJU34_20025 [Lunatimonas sp.]|uniref:DUF7255 family protein n=1 Tax=Lunatimonas sp. TaxID=2060141 RepID=UPI00263A7ADA|nr:hypothetical protein [Lunatimonas sp.]MCC5939578.1 hypothetical protein [Lunatimonas sp.]
MHHLKVSYLIQALDLAGQAVLPERLLEAKDSLLDDKANGFLMQGYQALDGVGAAPRLKNLTFDFQLDRCLFVFDDEVHFNRYRLETLRSELYSAFYFPWHGAYLRLCRQQEKQCMQSGMQQRIWYGPPLAAKCFGESEEPGDLAGNGSAGWKLNAYNDLQYDLISRLHGYKLIRLSGYENLMVGGSLKKVDQLLLRPDEKTLGLLANWLLRKTE